MSIQPLRRPGLLMLGLLAVLLLPPPALGDSTDMDDNRTKGGGYWGNFIRIPIAAGAEMIRTDREGLLRNTLAIGSVGLAMSMDQEIRDWSQEQRGRDSQKVSDVLYEVGDRSTATRLFVGAYGYSLLSRDTYLTETLHLAFQSLAVTQVFTALAKDGVRRMRPIQSPDDPWVQDDGQSFFSGHASGTWATMAVVAKRYPHRPMVGRAAYGLATAVALSRVHDDGHWTSDIVAGSLVGYGIAHLTVEMSPFAEHSVVAYPVLDEDVRGIAIHARF